MKNIEICTDSLEGAFAADKYGAKRIELSTALSLGGLTPNYGLIQQCVTQTNIEVHVLIRHKEGDFNYTFQDIKLMKIDIYAASMAGAKGVVFGVLNHKNMISNFNLELVKFSKDLGLEVTFHRAFDFVNDYKLAIKKIVEFGFDRLLTSGLQHTAIEGIEVITYLHKKYGNKIQIMAGSGINEKNVLKIAATGIKDFHFTARKSSSDDMKFSMGKKMLVDENKIKNIILALNA